VARFDVYERADGGAGYLLDCQENLLSELNSRFVVPLLPLQLAPRPARHLNPVFRINNVECALVTQFAASVLKVELGAKVSSLLNDPETISSALDVLLFGV